VARAAVLARDACARGQRALAHLLELGPRRDLLGEQRGLNAVEEALEPPDELCLRDPKLGVRRNLVLGERQRQALQLVAEFGGKPLLELGPPPAAA
jgi:hypothetical protein